MKAPIVSIITATRNRPQLLSNALAAMKEQTLEAFESIVVDDASDADTRGAYDAVYGQLDDRFILELPSQPGDRPVGPAVGRNRGIRKARGKFIAFCDDDDLWRLNNHLSFGIEMLDSHGADMLFSNMRGECDGRITVADWFPRAGKVLDSGLRLSNKPVLHDVSHAAFMNVLQHHLPHLNGCIMRRELLDEIDMFWEAAPFQEDLDLVIRAADASRRILYRPDCVARFNTSPRGSWAMSIASVERSLAAILVANHIITSCRRSVTRHRARGIESWHRRVVAKHLLEQRRRGAALSMAWTALANQPTMGGVKSLFTTALGCVRPVRNSRPTEPQPASASPVTPG